MVADEVVVGGNVVVDEDIRGGSIFESIFESGIGKGWGEGKFIIMGRCWGEVGGEEYMTSDGWGQVGGIECGIKGGRKRGGSGGSEEGEEDGEHSEVHGRF